MSVVNMSSARTSESELEQIDAFRREKRSPMSPVEERQSGRCLASQSPEGAEPMAL